METSKDKSLACEICHKVFSCRKFLRAHFLNHTRDRPHVCDFCNKAFPFPKDLKRHKLIHTGERDFACDLCGQTFARNYSLTAHRRLHSGEKPYQCEICRRSFSRKYQLLVHQQAERVRVLGVQQDASKKDNKAFPCDVCHKRFGKKSSLNKHRYVHMEDKPFVCNVCHEGFSQKSYMVRHIYKHTGERPFVCDFCQKGFTRKGGLVEHLRVHTGEKPFECEVCHLRFAHSSHYRRHRAKYHSSAMKDGGNVSKRDSCEDRSEDSTSNQGSSFVDLGGVVIKREEDVIMSDHVCELNSIIKQDVSNDEQDGDVIRSENTSSNQSSSFVDLSGVVIKRKEGVIMADHVSEINSIIKQDISNVDQDGDVIRLENTSSNQGDVCQSGITVKQEDSVTTPSYRGRVSKRRFKKDSDITEQDNYCSTERDDNITRSQDDIDQNGVIRIKQEENTIIPDC